MEYIKVSRLSGFWDSELQVIRWRQSGLLDLQIRKPSLYRFNTIFLGHPHDERWNYTQHPDLPRRGWVNDQRFHLLFFTSVTGPDDFLDALRKFVSVRSAGSDNSLFMLSDKRTAALDQSLSELNLVSLLEGDRYCRRKQNWDFHCLKILVRTNTEVVWRTISDFQKDPYTTGLSIFSKITDKILFRWVLSKNRITSMLTDHVKHDKFSYFQPCRGTTTRGGDGRTAAGLISYFWHFFLGFAVF